MIHEPVMLEEVLRYLDPQPGKLIVDGTVGPGGHSRALLERLGPSGRVIAMDRDAQILEIAKERLSDYASQIQFVHDNYTEIPVVLNRQGVQGCDGILLDLGMSSPQVDEAQRGFSFLREGPLDMRMDTTQMLTAEKLVNHASAEELNEIIFRFGEERYARRIVRKIVTVRKQEPIKTTTQLARVIASAVPPQARHSRIHPATRAFQALRMAVNNELGALTQVLDVLPEVLNVGAGVSIISFHSLEDRAVKHVFAKGQREGYWRIETKKPISPSSEEIQRNSRARSAKLRAIKKES